MIDLFPFLTQVDSVEDDLSTEDVRPQNDYLTKKDVKVIAVGLVVFFVIGYPVYRALRENANNYLCKENLRAISTAMESYANDNDGRLPPLFMPGSTPDVPALDSKGLPFTWASNLVATGGFDIAKKSFVCPDASDQDTVQVEGSEGKPMGMSYGMYAAYGLRTKTSTADPGLAVLVTETSNGGADDTYDPHPLIPEGGKNPMDAYIIGWQTGDTPPASSTFPGASVTRLAFANTAKGLSAFATEGRHGKQINVLFLDGHFQALDAQKLSDKRYWQLPVGEFNPTQPNLPGN